MTDLRPGAGGRVAVPTVEDLNAAILDGFEMAACAGVRHGFDAALTVVLLNGAVSTICLNELAALQLFAALKVLFPSIASAPASGAITETTVDGDTWVQVGHRPG